MLWKHFIGLLCRPVPPLLLGVVALVLASDAWLSIFVVASKCELYPCGFEASVQFVIYSQLALEVARGLLCSCCGWLVIKCDISRVYERGYGLCTAVAGRAERVEFWIVREFLFLS